MPIRKYSKEQVCKAVEESNSYSDVFEKLGIMLNGGSYPWIKSMIKDYNISTDHFHSQPRKSRAKKEFVLTETDTRMKAKDLKKGMLEGGIEEKCSICSLSSWLSRPIRLDIDHIDGNPLNNVLSNLQFLCPNCHRQKTIDCTKPAKSYHKHKNKECQCGKFISNTAKACQSCSAKRTKINWPDRSYFLEIVWVKTMTELAEELGVSDNGIRKHCKNNNIPFPNRQYWVAKFLGKEDQLLSIRKEIEENWLQSIALAAI